MTPEAFHQVLTLAEAGPPQDGQGPDAGLRELPAKSTLAIYLSSNAVGLTIAGVEAIAVDGPLARARTTKGDLYLFAVVDVFAVNVEGRAHPKAQRRAGFG